MGIVVSVFMLMGLLLLWPWPSALTKPLHRRPVRVKVIAVGVLLAGAWNALWHGLRHLDAFWGIAALVSGVLMMATAALVLRWNRRDAARIGAISGAVPPTAVADALAWLLFLALFACFLLYAVTLVQLNLGYPIIGL
jgi:hypothetical protein